MESIKKWFDNNPTWKRAAIFLLVAAALYLAWKLFLSIVKAPPIETTPAMIMIWVSFAVVIFTLFPGLLNKIKRIRIKDFELELQESVTKATSLDYLSVTEGPDYHVTNKSDFRNFAKLFLQAKRNPKDPILLLVNVRSRKYISIHALFIYLYFLDLYNSNVICLFISSSDPLDNWRDINKDEVIGVVEGKKTLQELLFLFPSLIRMVTNDDLTLLTDIDLFSKDKLVNYFRTIYEQRERIESDNNEFLSQNDVRNYFISHLNEEGINYETSKEDEKSVLNAIIKNEKYLIVYKGNKLHSVIPLVLITNDISKKVLLDMLKDRDNK